MTLAVPEGRDLVPRFPGSSVIYVCRDLWEQLSLAA
jgi:hypothetical protein